MISHQKGLRKDFLFLVMLTKNLLIIVMILPTAPATCGAAIDVPFISWQFLRVNL